MSIKEYTPLQWAEIDGLTMQEIEEFYGNDIVAFYADEQSAVSGCRHKNDTYSIFGCGMDQNGLSCKEMIIAIISGY